MAPTTDASPVRLTIAASDPLEAEEHLNMAVDELQRIALAGRANGILVTKTGPGCFTAELSDSVPYGLTQEKYLPGHH